MRRRPRCWLASAKTGIGCFELEADATIPAEYVLLALSRRTGDAELEAKIGAYLRRIQGAHGGWPLFHDGDFDVSASVKAYFALKMIGDSTGRAAYAAGARGDFGPWRRRRANVFTRICWRFTGSAVGRGAGDAGRDHAAAALVSVPSDKMSYWARTVSCRCWY